MNKTQEPIPKYKVDEEVEYMKDDHLELVKSGIIKRVHYKETFWTRKPYIEYTILFESHHCFTSRIKESEIIKKLN